MVDGYARFIYLVATSREILAPPPLIDEVWHIHLADHDEYLGVFSNEVVGRAVRHTKGRPRPGADPAYVRTRQRYVEEFGKPPFAKLWPKPDAEKSRLPMLWLGTAGALVLAGWLGGFDQMMGLGIVLGVASLVYLWAVGPWTLAKRGADSGGCGGVAQNDNHKPDHDDDSDSDGDGDGGGD
jgi:hypothetical protein